jgi:hypothetical protein
MTMVWCSIMFCPTRINFGWLGFDFNGMELCLLQSLFSCHASISYMNELLYFYIFILKKNSSFHELCFIVGRFCFIQNLNLEIFFKG